MFIVAANSNRGIRKSPNEHGVAGPRGLFVSTTLALAVLLSFGAAVLQAADVLPKVAKTNVNGPVTVTDNGGTWTLDNGIVRATINKNDSNMPSLIYHGINTMGPGGFWEQVPTGTVTQTLTIDPAKNGGERAEVAVKGVNGKMDIEVRYTLERGVSGIYTYAQFSHEASYPAAGEGESRFILQLSCIPWPDRAKVSRSNTWTGCSTVSSS